MFIKVLSLVAMVCLQSACDLDSSTGARANETKAGQLAKAPDYAFQGYSNIGLRIFSSGFKKPIFVASAPGLDDTIFVVEQTGQIQRLSRSSGKRQGQLLDVKNRLSSSRGEMGLLGLAFHPDFKKNRLFYVNYTSTSMRDTVAQFKTNETFENAQMDNEKILLSISDPATNHNGGMLAFGPDGFLYVGTGDGGGAGDRFKTSRDPKSLLAKMLRIDVNQEAGYGIPKDNPFIGNPAYRPEIWATGLRNPWRYSFDRLTGDLFIADVGQNAFEEIHLQKHDSRGGEDYGWNIMEGKHCFPADAKCETSGLSIPIAEYDHSQGCSVTGGYVYRGKNIPELQGKYLFGDYCNGNIWQLEKTTSTQWTMTQLAATGLQISSFGEDNMGELYVVDHRGTIFSVSRLQRTK